MLIRTTHCVFIQLVYSKKIDKKINEIQVVIKMKITFKKANHLNLYA